MAMSLATGRVLRFSAMSIELTCRPAHLLPVHNFLAGGPKRYIDDPYCNFSQHIALFGESSVNECKKCRKTQATQSWIEEG